MNWQQLIELAEMLAGPPAYGEARGRPQQTHLRKAVSAAYYAMFHALANSNADTMNGTPANVQNAPGWVRTQRALNHGTAKTQMAKKAEMADFHADIRNFGNTFIALQIQRTDADYNPAVMFRRSQTVSNIRRAHEAITKFLAVSAQERREFASYVLFGRR